MHGATIQVKMHIVISEIQEDTKRLFLYRRLAYEYNNSDNKPTPLGVIAMSVTTLSCIN